MYIATLNDQVNPPTSGPASAGPTAISSVVPGPGWAAPLPAGSAPVYHADLSGPAFAPGTPVVLALSNGGHLYIAAAPGYVGLTPSAVAAQSGFSGF